MELLWVCRCFVSVSVDISQCSPYFKHVAGHTHPTHRHSTLQAAAPRAPSQDHGSGLWEHCRTLLGTLLGSSALRRCVVKMKGLRVQHFVQFRWRLRVWVRCGDSRFVLVQLTMCRFEIVSFILCGCGNCGTRVIFCHEVGGLPSRCLHFALTLPLRAPLLCLHAETNEFGAFTLPLRAPLLAFTLKTMNFFWRLHFAFTRAFTLPSL